MAKYCTFLKDRGTVSTTISKQLTSIRKVLAWRASVGGEASHHRELQEVIKWVDLFHEQMPNVAMPSRAKLQRSNLPKAKEVLALQKQVGRCTVTVLMGHGGASCTLLGWWLLLCLLQVCMCAWQAVQSIMLVCRTVVYGLCMNAS